MTESEAAIRARALAMQDTTGTCGRFRTGKDGVRAPGGAVDFAQRLRPEPGRGPTQPDRSRRASATC